MSQESQNKDFEWYRDHLHELYAEYGTCTIAIKNKTVLGTYSNFGEAVRETAKTEEPGTFIVQRVGPDESAYTEYLFSLSEDLVNK